MLSKAIRDHFVLFLPENQSKRGQNEHFLALSGQKVLLTLTESKGSGSSPSLAKIEDFGWSGGRVQKWLCSTAISGPLFDHFMLKWSKSVENGVPHPIFASQHPSGDGWLGHPRETTKKGDKSPFFEVFRRVHQNAFANKGILVPFYALLYQTCIKWLKMAENRRFSAILAFLPG